MKKLLLILLLSLYPTISKADKYPNSLFGVELFKHISNYADINKGKLYEWIPNTYTYSDEYLIDIKRNPLFDSYYVRTNNEFIVHNITARKEYIDTIQNFQNKCLGDKSELIDKFSVYFGIDTTDFNLEYFEDETNNGIFDDTSFDFISNNIKFQFAIYCGYFPNGEEIVSVLFCSLVSQEYLLNHVHTRWKKILPFDNAFIKLFAMELNSSEL